jgi:hypothetical protein
MSAKIIRPVQIADAHLMALYLFLLPPIMLLHVNQDTLESHPNLFYMKYQIKNSKNNKKQTMSAYLHLKSAVTSKQILHSNAPLQKILAVTFRLQVTMPHQSIHLLKLAVNVVRIPLATLTVLTYLPATTPPFFLV